ncbi:MAG: prepilin peptidase [Rhodospirillales bacterium]|nr:prepilin peptidase [Rhodospirillales bacterium]
MSPTATSVLLVAHLLTLATMMGLVLAAAIGDIKTYRIPNAVSFALLALYPFFALTAPYPVAPLESLGVMAATLALGFALFSMRLAGGGDVKLLTALTLYAGPALVMDLVLVIAVAGGAIAIVMLSERTRFVLASAFDQVGSRTLRDAFLADVIPYGVAIAAGAVFLALRLAALTVDGTP